jgi:hypothetical protein
MAYCRSQPVPITDRAVVLRLILDLAANPMDIFDGGRFEIIEKGSAVDIDPAQREDQPGTSRQRARKSGFIKQHEQRTWHHPFSICGCKFAMIGL